MNQTARKALELIPSRTGRPRLNKSSRILARFYEPLFLLRALGQTRGVHTRRPRDADQNIEIKRKFLENLCFVCDFMKGGKSCTAIGLEERSYTYKFWLASNGRDSDIAIFLRNALKFLCCASSLDGMELDARKREFTQFCAIFAQSRIDGEQKLVQAQARLCLDKMRGAMNKKAYGDLIPIMQQILDQQDPIELCYFSYRSRHSTWISKLKFLASKEEQNLGLDGKRSPFYLVQHHIGRLSHHIRAPRELIRDSRHMEQVLQTYTVEIVDLLPGVQIPIRDTHTNLKGILKRMFRDNDAKEKQLVEEGLLSMDKVSGTFETFLDCYKQAGVDVDVHAEIKVLEHFYRSELRFAGNDPFIACSKPACLCCELYVKYHPARIVIPASHKKVWTKWSPPKVEYGAELSDRAIEQRKILSKITDNLREEIINQVLQRSKHSHWHPDSRTGITDSYIVDHQVISMLADNSETSDSESNLGFSDGSEREDVSDVEDGGVSLLTNSVISYSGPFVSQ